MSISSNLLVKVLLAFFSTTMDDFAIMLVFFSKAKIEYASDIRMGYLKVIAGQTIGFTIVLCVSLLGMLIGLVVPEDYIDLIGFFPFVVGLYKTYELVEEEGCFSCCCTKSEKPSSETASDTINKGEYERVKTADDDEAKVGEPTYSESISSYNNPAESSSSSALALPEEEQESNIFADSLNSACRGLLDPLVLEVMTYALIVSVDNIAIYMSLFASLNPWEVLLTVALFYLLLFVNIFAAFLLMKFEFVAACFQNNSKYLVPALLVGLGLYILSDSIAWPFRYD